MINDELEYQKRKMEKRKADIRKKRRGKRLLLWSLCLLALGLGCALTWFSEPFKERVDPTHVVLPDWVKRDYLTPNPYSRPGDPLKKIDGIVVHYVANPGTSANHNRGYFESLGVTGERSASSHFIIGLQGEIIQTIPIGEIAYATQSRNFDTISIECCHPDESGKFSKDTYKSLVRLTAWLCKEFDLNEMDVTRHYDANGKNCPKYYVEHEDAWEAFRKAVKKELKEKE